MSFRSARPLVGLLVLGCAACSGSTKPSHDGPGTGSFELTTQKVDLVGNPEVKPIADEVDAKLKRVVDAV